MTLLYAPETPEDEALLDTDNEIDLTALQAAYAEHLAAVRDDDLAAMVERQLLRMGRLFKSLKSDEAQLSAHAQEIAGRLSSNKRRQDGLKSWMLNLMTFHGVPKVMDPLLTVYTQGNPPSWEIEDDAKVPDKFKCATLRIPLEEVPEGLDQYVTGIEVMKTWLDAELKDSGEVPAGTRYVTDRQHVRVR